MVNAPMEFKGTQEERLANFRTHWFDRESHRCLDCDCRMFSISSYWPCGAGIPRHEVSEAEALGRQVAGLAMEALLDSEREE